MKKYSFLILAFMPIFSLPACSQQAETAPSSLEELNQSSSAGEAAGQSLASFSYEEDAAIYKDGDPRIKRNAVLSCQFSPKGVQ